MAIIGMAIFSTAENKKDKYLRETLFSLSNTVDFSKHRLMVSINAHTEETLEILNTYKDIISKIIFNGENLGTAEAINKVWQHRNKGEHAVKMDDDVFIHDKGWLDRLEECVSRDKQIGIIGLKRKDCWENPEHSDRYYRSELKFLPQTAGQRWLSVEKVRHVIGTCQLYNSDLLEQIGYLWQPGKYGYDDVLAAYRSEVAGFYNCFYHHIEIDHIDAGDTEFQSWKERHSGEYTQQVIEIVNQYIKKERPIYYNPFQ